MDAHTHSFAPSEWPFADPINTLVITTNACSRTGILFCLSRMMMTVIGRYSVELLTILQTAWWSVSVAPTKEIGASVNSLIYLVAGRLGAIHRAILGGGNVARQMRRYSQSAKPFVNMPST